MDEQRRRALGQSGSSNACQPIDLEARSAIALDAVRARDRDHDLVGVIRAQSRHVGRQRLAAGALGRIVVAIERRPGHSGGGQEFIAGLAIGRGEGMDIGHVEL